MAHSCMLSLNELKCCSWWLLFFHLVIYRLQEYIGMFDHFFACFEIVFFCCTLLKLSFEQVHIYFLGEENGEYEWKTYGQNFNVVPTFYFIFVLRLLCTRIESCSLLMHVKEHHQCATFFHLGVDVLIYWISNHHLFWHCVRCLKSIFKLVLQYKFQISSN
jgi:hypothetical protein